MSNPFWDSDNEDEVSYKKTIVMCIAAASLVMLLFLVFLYINSTKEKEREEARARAEETSIQEEEDDFEFVTSNLTSSDLGFWDLYDDSEELDEEENTEPVSVKDKEGNKKKESKEEKGVGDVSDDEKMNKESTDDESPSDEEMDDGNHLAVEDKEGKKTWYEILSAVPKNTYDLEHNLSVDGEKKQYVDSSVNSVFGIDLSKYNGAVDWNLVKESGVEFVMLRIASRGYGTGVINLDENFVANATAAKEHGIYVGGYFYSQAVTEAEAVEEASYAVGAVLNYGINYPIAIDVEYVENDTSRTEKLSVNERTNIVKAFCDTVKQYGFKPVIYANRDMLIGGLSLSTLKDYDIWLSDRNEYPDFPYRYTMWQYSQSGSINGIAGSVDLDISFVRYEEK